MGAKDDLIVLGVVGVGIAGALLLLGIKAKEIIPDIEKWKENVASTVKTNVDDFVDTIEDFTESEEVEKTVDNVIDNILDYADRGGGDMIDTIKEEVDKIATQLRIIPKTHELMKYAEEKDYRLGSMWTIQGVLVNSGDIVDDVVLDLKKAVDIGIAYDEREGDIAYDPIIKRVIAGVTDTARTVSEVPTLIRRSWEGL